MRFRQGRYSVSVDNRTRSARPACAQSLGGARIYDTRRRSSQHLLRDASGDHRVCRTFLAVLVGAVLALRVSSRATGLRILRVALYSVPFEIGLLLLVLALDTR